MWNGRAGWKIVGGHGVTQFISQGLGLLVVVVAGCGEAAPPDNGPPPGRGVVEAPPPEPRTTITVPKVDDLPGHQTAAVLLAADDRTQAAIETPEAAIETWGGRAESVAIVRVESAKVFETDAPPFLSTRYALTMLKPIAGSAPKEIVIRGGVLGNRTVGNSEAPPIETGGEYLGFFLSGHQLAFASPMIDAAHASVLGKVVAVDQVPRMIEAARSKTGGAR
jgi:hypothetical protein